MIVNINESERPLCPNTNSNLHRLHTEIVNAIYDEAEKDEDNEFKDPKVAALYHKIAYDRFSGRMYLYKEVVQPYNHYMLSRQQSVQAFYFRCYVCGFTIPAVAGSW